MHVLGAGPCAHGCAGGSDAPAFALLALALVGVVLLALTLRMWRHARRGPDVALSITTGLLTGVTVLVAALFVCGMRHYDGTTGSGSHRHSYACAAWWEEAGLPAGAGGVAGDGGFGCRQRAVDAVGPALGESALAGVLGGLVVVAGLTLGRRRTVSRRGNSGRGNSGRAGSRRNHAGPDGRERTP